MAPTYPTLQYSEFTAATYRRKHLNLLIRDFSEENDRVYGRTIQACEPASEPSLNSQEQDEAPGTVTKKTFVPLYAEGGIKSRELAHKVRNKRTPSGNFVESINAALFQDPPKNTVSKQSLTQDALSGTRNLGSTCGPSAQEGCMDSQPNISPADEAPQTETMERSWLMPHQTGNRKQGRCKRDKRCRKEWHIYQTPHCPTQTQPLQGLSFFILRAIHIQLSRPPPKAS
ncbi:hypothetical protein BSKO_02963 [Bryopsis sp. KO-2023]|nr:hypothetical protein BSKO_02963 [Bryopsis sp. KO-2023]